MPDRKDKKPIPVTDPSVLAELNSGEPTAVSAPPKKKQVVDPEVLAELESADTYPQKKSPVESERLPAQPLSESGSGSSAQQTLPSEDWSNPQASVTFSTPTGITQGLHPQSRTPINYPQVQTEKKTIHGHINDSYTNLVTDVATAGYENPLEIATRITNPRGDPNATGNYYTARVKQLEAQRNSEMIAPPNGMTREDVTDKYNQKLNQLKESANVFVRLQQANAEYNSDKVLPEDAPKTMTAIDKKLAVNLDKSMSDQDDAIAEKEHQDQKNKIVRDQKYDPVRLGLEYSIQMGDHKAKNDLAKYNSGQILDENRKLEYEYQGLTTLQWGAAAAEANGQKEVADELRRHSDNIDERLQASNPKYFRKLWGNQIGDYVYRNVDNPLYGTIFTRPELTKAEIKKYGKEAGLTDDQIEKIRPQDVPTASSIYGQAAQSFLNTLTFSNEKDPIGHLFTGSMPEAQKHPDNWKGVVGHIAGGAGMMGAFVTQSGLVGGILKETKALGDVVSNASRYEHAANLVPLAISNYSSAHDQAKELIGDAPEDAAKVNIYTAIVGTIGTAIMSIDPATKIGKEALGAGVSKDLLNTLKKYSVEELAANPELIKSATVNTLTKIGNATGVTAQHLGSQAFIMGANKIADNVVDMIFDPEHRHGVMDNVGDAAISAVFSMALPSVMAGISRSRSGSFLNKEMVYDIGRNPDAYLNDVSSQFEKGNISQDDVVTVHSGITNMRNAVAQTPKENIDGTQLTEQQKKDYAFNLFQEYQATNRLQELDNSATQAGTPPDKALIDPMKKKISELQKERQEIINTPPIEKPIIAPNHERSVATDQQSETPASAPKEKTEEKIVNTEKENIPLSPTNKTEDHAISIQNEEGRQSHSETNNAQGGEEEARVREAANSERRNEQEADRVLTEQPEPPKRARRKLKPEIPEPKDQSAQELPLSERKPEDRIPVVHNDAFSQWDQGKLEGKPESEHKQEIAQATPDEKIGGGESFQEFSDRTHKAWEETKNSARDQTAFIAHSSVMRVIEAGEEHGWDNVEKLKEAYNNIPEPEVGKITTYKTEKGEVHLTRHAESEDGSNGLLRTKDTPLTKDGEVQAKEDIADVLKKEGIKPPVIQTDGQPRTSHTAEIVAEQLQEKPKKDRRKLKPEMANHGTEPPTERRNGAPSEKESSATKEKNKKDAGTQSKKQQQKVPKQGGKPEYEGTQQARGEDKATEAENSDSHIGGQKKEEVTTPKKRKGKAWNMPEYLKRRDATLKEESNSIEEHIAKVMLGMNNKQPQHKWSFASVKRHIPRGAEERRIVKQFASDHPNAASVDQWAKDLHDEIEQGHHPFQLNRMDDKGIADLVREMISTYPSKAALLEHIENLHEARKEVEPTEEEYIASRQVLENESRAAEIMSQFDNPFLQQAKHEEIATENIPDSDVEKIDAYLSSKVEDGTLKYIVPFDDDYQELYKQLTPEGQALLDKVIAAPEDKAKEVAQLLNEKALKLKEEYERQSKERPEPAKANQGNESTAENENAPPRGNGPVGGEAKPVKSDNKDLHAAIEKTRGGSISDKEFNKAIQDANSLREKAKALENKSDFESQAKRYELLDQAHKIQKEATDKIAPFEKIVDSEDEMLGLESKQYNESKCRTLSKEHQKKYGGTYEEVDVTNQDGSRVRHAIVVHDDYVYEPQSDALIKREVFDDFFNTDLSGKEKQNQAPADERSVATVPESEANAPATKAESKPAIPKEKLSTNELIRKKQDKLNSLSEELDNLSFQKEELESKLESAYASTKPDADVISSMEEQVSDLKGKIRYKQDAIELKKREIEIQKGYSNAADNLRKVGEKIKKSGKGMVGSFPIVNPKIVGEIFNHAADVYEKFGNIHIAALHAMEWARQQFAGEKGIENLVEKDIEDILSPHILPLRDEPIIKNPEHLQTAREWLREIESGELTHEEVRQEILDSERVYDKTKGNVLNWIDWHLQGRSERPWEQPEVKPEEDITSIKNATTRLRREQFGLDEEIQAAKKEFGETWEEAKQKIEKGYDPEYLVEELSKKPRPITDVENAILLHQQNTKEILLHQLNADINTAAEKGDPALLEESRVAKARILDELQRLYDVNKAVGTENARGLAARAMMVDRKYSLVNMIAEKRATANEGMPLTEQQQAEIESLHQKIQETQDAFDRYVQEAESQIIELQRKALPTDIKNKKSISDKLMEWADKIENANKNTAFTSPIPITPKMVADAVRIIAAGVKKGEQLTELIKTAINNIKTANPGISEHHLEKAINKELLDAGISEPSYKKERAQSMSGLFVNGRLDREAVRLRVEADRAKAQFDIQLKKDRERQLSATQKAQNALIKWHRFALLSNPLTLGKLSMAAFTRLTTTPLEDLVGGFYSELLPQLAKGAIGEGGGLHVRETARAYTQGLMLGLKDAGDVMSRKSQGKSELDVLFGKADELPPEAIDFMGQLHSAIKAPVKRIIFERQLEKRLRRTAAIGVDITDPLVQTSIMMDAYKDANRAIFMQDNRVAEGWRDLVNRFDKADIRTGKTPYKGIATTMKWMVPFVKVPTNIAAEIGTHAYGFPVAAKKILHAAFTKGIENLSPEEKDIIMRNLKKGTLGIAAMALGYFNAQNFGGFYQQQQKKKEGEPEALGLKLFDEKIPAWFVESPIFQAMQLGATVRKVKDKVVHGQEQGIGEGLWAGALGLIEHVPLVDQSTRIDQIFKSPTERKWYVGELAKSAVDPAILTYLAKVTDPADQGSYIRKALAPENKRVSPKTIMEHIKSGLPYFREDLKEKKK